MKIHHHTKIGFKESLSYEALFNKAINTIFYRVEAPHLRYIRIADQCLLVINTGQHSMFITNLTNISNKSYNYYEIHTEESFTITLNEGKV